MEIMLVEEAYYRLGCVLAYGCSKQTTINEDSVLAVTESLGISRDQENLTILIADIGFESSCIADSDNNKFAILINLDQIKNLFQWDSFFLNLKLKSFKEQVTFILAHELQHFMQFQNGSIKQTANKDGILWKNQIRMVDAEKRAHIEISLGFKNAYFDLPWEQEANTVAKSVTSTLYPKKMWGLVKTDILHKEI